MSDYIEREKAFDAVLGQFCASSDETEAALNAAIEEISAIPAADVRPVVTCGKCKYWELSKIEPSLRVCTYVCGAIFVRKAEDFCSRGEKREES